MYQKKKALLIGGGGTLGRYTAKELLQPIFAAGKLVYERPTLKEIHDYCAAQLDTLWDEVKRFDNPHNYYVDLSNKLWFTKHELLTHHK